MLKLWGSFVLLFPLLIFTNLPSIDLEVVSIVIVLLHTIIASLLFFKSNSRFKYIIIASLLLRTLFLFWDLYARSIFTLPHSGADTEYFWRSATSVLSTGFSRVGGELYAKILGYLILLIGPSRIIAQYFNVLFGVSVVLALLEIFRLLQINLRTAGLALWICALFPNSLVLSAILLREQIPTFCVALSLVYVVKWYTTGHARSMILSIIILLTGSLFHSGVIGILLGHFYLLVFYTKNKKFVKILLSLLFALVIGGVVFVTVTKYRYLFLRKFGSAQDLSDLVQQSNSRGGGSQYLTSLQMNNPIQLLLLSPIHMLYFLISPVPWNWRGVYDVFFFVFDSLFYLIVIIIVARSWKKITIYKSLFKGFLFMFIGATFIFGVGVHNAGTAIRHRQKILPIVLILLILLLNDKAIKRKQRSQQNLTMVPQYE